MRPPGSDPEREAILEIGIVVFRGDEVLEEWGSLIDPGRPIPTKITDLTGITEEMRSKEHAHDYRYFPEPDLMPFEPTAAVAGGGLSARGGVATGPVSS